MFDTGRIVLFFVSLTIDTRTTIQIQIHNSIDPYIINKRWSVETIDPLCCVVLMVDTFISSLCMVSPYTGVSTIPHIVVGIVVGHVEGMSRGAGIDIYGTTGICAFRLGYCIDDGPMILVGGPMYNIDVGDSGGLVDGNMVDGCVLRDGLIIVGFSAKCNGRTHRQSNSINVEDASMWIFFIL